MQTSKYLVTNRGIEFIEQVPVVGDVNVDTFLFDFDSEWDGFEKTLVLNIDGTTYADHLDSEDKVVLRNEVYNASEVTFGLFGTKGTGQNQAILSTPMKFLETIPSTFGQIRNIENLPDRDTWNLYTQEMLALVARGEATLEDIAGLISEFHTYCENFITQINEIKSDTKDYKDEASAILENVQEVKQDIIDMGSSRTFATFYLDAKTGGLYVVNAESLGNMGFFLKDGGLYVQMSTEIN